MSNTTKRIRRNILLRRAQAGKLLARTEMRISDDYRYDVMPDQSRQYLPVVLDDASFRNLHTARLYESDFRSKSGYASRNEDGTYTLCVHSNLYIQLREAA